jgi:hypothetical protein
MLNPQSSASPQQSTAVYCPVEIIAISVIMFRSSVVFCFVLAFTYDIALENNL